MNTSENAVNPQSKKPTRSLGVGVVEGFTGLTSDSVHVSISEREPKAAPSRAEVLASLPVSTEICATFRQSSGYIARVIAQVKRENPGMDFYVEGDRFTTYVWRMA